jgi:hypothetical protein
MVSQPNGLGGSLTSERCKEHSSSRTLDHFGTAFSRRPQSDQVSSECNWPGSAWSRWSRLCWRAWMDTFSTPGCVALRVRSLTRRNQLSLHFREEPMILPACVVGFAAQAAVTCNAVQRSRFMALLAWFKCWRVPAIFPRPDRRNPLQSSLASPVPGPKGEATVARLLPSRTAAVHGFENQRIAHCRALAGIGREAARVDVSDATKQAHGDRGNLSCCSCW